jgi:small subunit ribosomal protein S19
MSRSLKKGIYVNQKVLQKVKESKAANGKPVKVWDKACTVTPEFVGVTLAIHNGKDFENVKITEYMVGHRVGEFVQTTSWRGHSKKGKIAKTYGGAGRYEGAGKE